MRKDTHTYTHPFQPSSCSWSNAKEQNGSVLLSPYLEFNRRGVSDIKGISVCLCLRVCVCVCVLCVRGVRSEVSEGERAQESNEWELEIKRCIHWCCIKEFMEPAENTRGSTFSVAMHTMCIVYWCWHNTHVYSTHTHSTLITATVEASKGDEV